MRQVLLRWGWNLSAVMAMLCLASAVAQPRLDGGVDQTMREAAQQLWRDGPKMSPFTGVRWQEATPQVRVNGTWYELVAMNDLPAEQIVAFCQQVAPEDWQRRFQEDLPAVLMLMGHDPGQTAKLDLKDLQTGKEQIMEKVAMTEKNRGEIYKARKAQETATPATEPATQPDGAQ